MEGLTKLLELDPSNYQGLVLKAQVMFKLSNFDEAEECLLEASQVNDSFLANGSAMIACRRMFQTTSSY